MSAPVNITSDNLFQDYDDYEENKQRDDDLNKYNHRNVELMPVHWGHCVVNQCSHLPYNIDNHVVYEIECKESEMMTVSKDGRPWGKWYNSSRKNLDGKRRIARCKGSHECANDMCAFYANNGTRNRLQFQTSNQSTTCFTCGIVANRVSCPSIKIWEYDNTKQKLTVMHSGVHTCKAKKPRVISNKEIRKEIELNPKCKPNKLVNDKLTKMMVEDFSWKDVVNVANKFVDMRAVYNVREMVKADANPFGENFDALGRDSR